MFALAVLVRVMPRVGSSACYDFGCPLPIRDNVSIIRDLYEFCSDDYVHTSPMGSHFCKSPTQLSLSSIFFQIIGDVTIGSGETPGRYSDILSSQCCVFSHNSLKSPFYEGGGIDYEQ